jgi:hypothetical protein
MICSPTPAPCSVLPHRLNQLLTRPPARFLASPDPYMAFEAKPLAWLNLSHLEKASVFVMVRTSAMTANMLAFLLSLKASSFPQHSYLPTKVNQINFNPTSAKMASTTHSTGCTYNAIQKNLLSVAFCSLDSGSADSNTQRPSPVVLSTSFHHRRPTKRRPAMFLR